MQVSVVVTLLLMIYFDFLFCIVIGLVVLSVDTRAAAMKLRLQKKLDKGLKKRNPVLSTIVVSFIRTIEEGDDEYTD